MSEVYSRVEDRFILEHFGRLTYHQIAAQLGNERTSEGVRKRRAALLATPDLGDAIMGDPTDAAPDAVEAAPGDPDRDAVLAALLRGSATVEQLADLIDRGPARVTKIVELLQHDGYRVELRPSSRVEIADPTPAGRVSIPMQHFYDGRWIEFGIISDTHFCNKHERLDVTEAAYDFFQAEGVREVLHGGNWIDGYKESINKTEVRGEGAHTFEGQVSYFLDHYPARDGITTRFIDGDDHEGWFAKALGLSCGRRLVQTAKERGRDDLVYLGYAEADLEFYARSDGRERGDRPTIVRLFHPGGGSSYAVSYKAQKIVESYSEGEKPHVLLIGHLHKFDVCRPRGVYAVQMGTTAGQSLFMRKNLLRADVGFGLIRMLIDTDGTVKRFIHEWQAFYPEGFYVDRYDPFTTQPHRLAA